MKKYEEGDWVIDKKGRKFNWAFKLDAETTLWYTNHDYATPIEIEYSVHVHILFDVRQLYSSVLKDSYRSFDLNKLTEPEKIIYSKLTDTFGQMEGHIKYLNDKGISNNEYHERDLTKQYKLVTKKESITK
jgi:hypothetical protein